MFTLPQRELYRKLLSEWSDGGPNAEAHSVAAYQAARSLSSDQGADESSSQAKTTVDGGDAYTLHGDDSLENVAIATEGTGTYIDAEQGRENDIVIDEDDEQGEYDEEDESDDDDESDQNVEDNDDEDDEDNDKDEDRSEFDPDLKFEWLEPIDVKVTSTATLDECGEPKQVAYCQAKLIKRNQMRDDFYGEMERPSRETSMLAFDLFDRYGRLRSEFKTHPIIKGTGIWGQELDRGDMLLIEEIFVNQYYRRQRLGRRMIESLLTLAQQKTRSFVAFVRPTILRLHDLKLEWNSLQDDAARNRMADREEDRAVMFYRSLGFRRVGSTIWFAMTSNNDHPSHRLASTEDFNPPKVPLTALHSLLSPFQQISDPPSVLDQILSRNSPEIPDFLSVLQNCMQQKGSADACWTSEDKDGNTVLHLAASTFNVGCVKWILNQDFGTQLLQLRNNHGETPLELLQFKLEELRTQSVINASTVPVSDQFEGHSDSAVRCLILLKGLVSVESLVESQGPNALLQMVGGCTCGQCLKGFLSPRMSHALLCQAQIGYDLMNYDIYECSGPEWVKFHKYYLGYLLSRVRNNLKTNKSMRQGFVNLWLHIATCLKTGKAPNEPNVLNVVRDAGEWPPAVRNFLQRGGTVESVALEIYTRAMEQDEWTGDGTYQETFSEDIANLPECRNDLEFGYVSGMCGFRRISLTKNVDVRGDLLEMVWRSIGM